MSTHEHLILTDTRGQLPSFLQQFHRLVALGTKVLRKWDGAVWDHEKTSVVELRTPAAVIEAIAYVIANPAAAGLVRLARQWPGITVQPDQLGRCTWSARRPEYYFDTNNPAWPDVATLELSMPSLAIGENDLRTAIGRELAFLEHAAHDDVRSKGRSFLGPNRISRLSPFERAKSFEPMRRRNPTFAVGRGQHDELLQAVALLRDFRRSYREALDRWRQRVRSAVFPFGTWLMRCLHQVPVASR